MRIDWLDVKLPGWPPALDGLTVLHLSDLHVRPGDRRRQRLIQRAASIGADFVCITGDYGDVPAHGPEAVELLRNARGRLGTFAVMGNHDADVEPAQRPSRFAGDTVERTAAALEAAGIPVLRNEHVVANGLALVGLDDPHRLEDDVALAWRGLDPALPAIVLAHSWEAAVALPPGGPRLLLSGHTHGGQVRLPWGEAPHTNTLREPPVAAGLFRVGQTMVHLSPGLGNSHNLRFLVRPGAALITMRG